MKASRIAVLGAGSWGTSLAGLLANKGHEVTLWARQPAHAASLMKERRNTFYLPDYELPPSLKVTSDLKQALSDTELLISAVPTHGLRTVYATAREHIPANVSVVVASKGIETETLLMGSEVIAEYLPEAQRRLLCVLSGPSFAQEVASEIPTAVVVAAHAEDVSQRVQRILATNWFRVYTTDDMIGVEIGGALKNVIAIAVGVADGLGMGHNTRAGLITRGLTEISRLAVALGAHPLTFAGLSGMGDLVLTCTVDLSRNRSLGLELGRGRHLDDILASMSMVAEGVCTAKSAYHLGIREHVDMPITSEVYRVLYEGKAPREAASTLMARILRAERDD
ncbi:MAG: NAD(P)-dependent glycerol-3-phosphate dehydrogenase [Myxococcales bacterium]|nr:NAD(P)-dependent glycerol-3-phosphate dehydrogenase [Myxococcales bacterium]MCB9708090.1 NAD(P)-dependent glycerol-3-phosphate dehydrogenase [Myxococcales bacterium]